MQIDLDDVIDIFMHSEPGTEFYLCAEDEELHQVLDDDVDGVYDPVLADEIRADEEGYVPLPKITDEIRYEFMSDFAYSQSGRRRHMLLDALDDRHAFERFEEFAGNLGLEDDWNGYLAQRCEEYLGEWCDEQGIDLV